VDATNPAEPRRTTAPQPVLVPSADPPRSAVGREDILADFGHQLRNELNAIAMAANMLSATATSSEQRELSAIVETGANRVARLLDDVLDAAFIQSGDFELALHPFDVRASVESCLGMVVEEAGGKSLDLSFRAEPDVPSIIVGDSRRIEQVLLALLHGALERTEKGGIGVELSSQPRGIFSSCTSACAIQVAACRRGFFAAEWGTRPQCNRSRSSPAMRWPSSACRSAATWSR